MNNTGGVVQIPMLYGLILTQVDCREFISLLDEIQSQLFNSKTNLHVLLSRVPFQYQKAVYDYASAKKRSLTTPQDFANIFAEIKQELQGLPVVTLHIAVIPNQKTLEKINTWFMQNYSRKVLLDIVVQKDIIAGASIGLNGLFKDYSLKDKLAMYLAKTYLRAYLK